MKAATLKKEIHLAVDSTKDNEILEVVYTILRKASEEAAKHGDFWDELSKEQQTLIDQAIKEVDEGKVSPHHQVMKKLRKKEAAHELHTK